MTDFTQTINLSLRVYGPESTSKWGTMVWGVDNWGRIGDHVTKVGKTIAETFTNTTALTFATTKQVAESLTLTDVVCKGAFTTRTESMTLSSGFSDLALVDTQGYYHVFISDVTDAADRADTDWTDVSDPSTDWTETTAASTTWS